MTPCEATKASKARSFALTPGFPKEPTHDEVRRKVLGRAEKPIEPSSSALPKIFYEFSRIIILLYAFFKISSIRGSQIL
jgi:hypothetical protein